MEDPGRMSRPAGLPARREPTDRAQPPRTLPTHQARARRWRTAEASDDASRVFLPSLDPPTLPDPVSHVGCALVTLWCECGEQRRRSGLALAELTQAAGNLDGAIETCHRKRGYRHTGAAGGCVADR